MQKSLWNRETIIGIAAFIFSNFLGAGLQVTGWTNIPAGVSIMVIGTIVAIALMAYGYQKHKPVPLQTKEDVEQRKRLIELREPYLSKILDAINIIDERSEQLVDKASKMDMKVDKVWYQMDENRKPVGIGSAYYPEFASLRSRTTNFN
jgi:hypothetical protein